MKTFPLHPRSLFACLAASMALMACGGGGSPSAVDSPSLGATVTSVDAQNPTSTDGRASAENNVDSALADATDTGTGTDTGEAADSGTPAAADGGGSTATPASETYFLRIRAYGTPAGGVYPRMAVRVAGWTLATFDLTSTSPADYDVPLTGPLGPGAAVDVAFLNDGVTATEDRNLFVLSLQSGSTFVVPTTPGTILDRGAGASAYDGVNTAPGQSAIYSAGALRWRWPPAESAEFTAAHWDAARLLQQASFGARLADISHVADVGAAAWIDEQMALPFYATYVTDVQAHFDRGEAWRPGGSQYNRIWPVQRFWANVATRPDQLRQRVAFALHQIFMVSQADSNLSMQVRAYARYQDNLHRLAFGNYRELLEEMALSPAMGIYLSHMRNRPADPTTGRLPDENFAREVMQLFSIGLYELNADGTLKRDSAGQPIETYGNDDVMEMAKVFTGWGWGFPNSELTESNFRWGWPSYTAAGDTGVDLKRMKAYPGQHSEEAITLFAGKAWATSIPAGTSASQCLATALDTLFHHPNVGPFIGRQLIQHLVKSDPSPAYVGRITAVFNNNGHGVRGDLAAVVKAILLDAEARQPSAADHGKLREPILRVAQWVRAFSAQSQSGEFQMQWVMDDLQQRPFSAPSVFGYFRPGFVPPFAPLVDSGETAPELQIVNEATTSSWLNLAQSMTLGGLGWNGTARDVTTTYAELVGNGTVDNLHALLPRLGLLLYGRELPDNVAADVAEAIGSISDGSDAGRLSRAKLAVLIALTAPEYLVQH